jgi:hypothetical protein
MYLWAPQSETYSFYEETVILSIFIIICILGIFAAIYPSTCKTLLKFQKDVKKTSHSTLLKFEGHHPACDRFQTHTLIINRKKYCPGCLGLSIGAVISIMGVILYYFVGCPQIYGEISFWTGISAVFLALLLIIFLKIGKRLKFISNLALVIGSFLILIGLDNVKGNLIIELYLLLLVIFWILTRIVVSETSHEIICRQCQNEAICVFE